MSPPRHPAKAKAKAPRSLIAVSIRTGATVQKPFQRQGVGALGRAPERAPADARQSLNRRRAKSPDTAPAERQRGCITTRHTSNLSTVIGESAAIATARKGTKVVSTHWIPTSFCLRRFFFFLAAGPPSAPPAPRRCCRSEQPRQEPTRTQASKPPLPPSPFRRGLAQNETHPRRARPAVVINQGPRVRGAYRGDCGWIE
jgi:hypothetical protein